MFFYTFVVSSPGTIAGSFFQLSFLKILQNSRSHLNILGFRIMTRCEYHTEDSQILDGTVDRATWPCGFVYPCSNVWAHSYSEYGNWRSRGPELPNAWGCSWATLSPGVINKGPGPPGWGRPRGWQAPPAKHHMSRNLKNSRSRPDTGLLQHRSRRRLWWWIRSQRRRWCWWLRRKRRRCCLPYRNKLICLGCVW